MSEEIPGLEASVELLNLGNAVEDAYYLAHKMRTAWRLRRPNAITREEEHRLLERCKEIAKILEVAPNDVWVDYCQSPYCYACGHGCVCE